MGQHPSGTLWILVYKKKLKEVTTISKQERIDALWDSFGKRLYCSYKNEEALPWMIIGTVVCTVFFTLFPIVFLIWPMYWLYCKKNNAELSRNPEILAKRVAYETFVEKIKNDEV